MKIANVGTGYAGLVSGVCLFDLGHEVLCVNKTAKKIAMLNKEHVPIYEPSLDAVMACNSAAGRLHFTKDFPDAIASDAVMFSAVSSSTRQGNEHATYF